MTNRIKINYYDQFRCTADKCPFTCCQEWSIAVEDETAKKWNGLKLEKDDEHQAFTLCECLEGEDGAQAISLDENKQCPFLNKKKLCRLVAELDEGLLSETCGNYPRLINKFDNRREYTLDFGCPAVIDLVRAQSEPITFIKEIDKENQPEFLYLVREMILKMMQNEDYLITERMMMTFCILLELVEEKKRDQVTLDAYTQKEYLDGMANEITKMKFNLINSIWERNELFLDIIQVYREQELYVAQLADVILYAERLEEYYSDDTIIEKYEVFEKQYEKYRKLLKDYFVAEVFGSVLSEDMKLEDIVQIFQWITLEYSVIKQVTFLKWLAKEEQPLTYEVVRDYMMMISRIAGYGKNDIKTFLENSFESALWDWGYLALVTGNRKI